MREKTSQLLVNQLHAILALILLLIICYYWIDQPLLILIQHSLSKNAILFQFSTFCASAFKSSHWLALALLSGMAGLYLQFIAQHKQNAAYFLFFSACVIIAFIICFIFKFTFARYRPVELFNYGVYGFHFFSIKHAFNSMPSGHATAAFAGLFALAKLCKRRWLTVLCLAIAVIISLTRLVVAAHYPSDIIFGATIGIISVTTVEHFYTAKFTV